MQYGEGGSVHAHSQVQEAGTQEALLQKKTEPREVCRSALPSTEGGGDRIQTYMDSM